MPTTTAIATGHTLDQVDCDTDPTSQTCARATSLMSARVRRKDVRACSSQVTPTPISTSRSGLIPWLALRPGHARIYMTIAVTTPPMRAAAGTPMSASHAPQPFAKAMAATAAALDPAVMPRMSGVARGLRAINWLRAPAVPSAKPTKTETRARGRESESTTTFSMRVPPPSRMRATSSGVSG